MASILDSVLDNVEPRNSIVSEQHDVNQINVGSSMPSGKPSDGLRGQIDRLRNGSGWDEAEYGISRVAQIEKLEVALREAEAYEATPEGMEAARVAVENALNEMRQRALNRAGLFVRNGRVSVAVAGQPAWHGLGVNVQNAMTGAEAMQFANLNIMVEKSSLMFRGTDGEYHDTGMYGLRYTDANDILYAPVTDRYKVIQNQEAFDFMDGIASEFGAKYEAAGAIQGGKKVFLLMHLPQQGFTLNGEDRNEAYALFLNVHGGECGECFATNHRTVCANTVRQATAANNGRGLRIRHTGNLTTKIADAKRALNIAVKGFEEYKANAEALASVRDVSPRPFFTNLLETFLEYTEVEEAVRKGNVLEGMFRLEEIEKAEKEIEKKAKRGDMLLEQMLTAYDESTNGIGGMRGTAWAAYNAVTQVTSHGKVDLKQSQDARKRSEKRFEGILSGDRDNLNQQAMQQALALAM